jgi:uncharacterized membrane protein YGL010W
MALYHDEHTKLGTKLTHMVGIPMIVASIPTAFVHPAAAAGLFIGGWALQFAGHYVFENNHPAFFGDPYYLLVGPLWVAVEWVDLLGLRAPGALATPRDEGSGASEANGEFATDVR